MLHPRSHALTSPSKIAIECAKTGQRWSFLELEKAANQGAHLLQSMGLARGDVVAVMLENEAAVFLIGWAAERTGIYLTSISTRLSARDAAYIVRDCGAKLAVLSDQMSAIHEDLLDLEPGLNCIKVNDWMQECAKLPDSPVEDESPGSDMLYSSGTTGRPKGVKPSLPQGPLGEETALVKMGRALYGMDQDMVYLSTSPLYHAAPLRWAMTVHRIGGKVVVMPKFDAENALELIQKHRITHGTWVPTHFVRLLKLPDEVRARYDLSTQKAAIHAGAPCPARVKSAMIDWWGPIVEEYYSGTEMCGMTAISAREWIQRPGSVGKAVLGEIHILADDGTELPIGEVGSVYFAEGPSFEYHNDPSKTASAYNEHGWATLGDIGRLDAEGYLYLTDRKNFMIISGGVNIYPQEIENLLITHPAVADVAVIGVPDEEMGEVAIAVVQLSPGLAGDAAMTESLRAFAREGLGGIKTPKRFEFRDDLPREPTGKLLKGKLLEEFRRATP